jgi:hypothetical protein
MRLPPEEQQNVIDADEQCPTKWVTRTDGWLTANSKGFQGGGADLRNFTLAACLLGCFMASCSPKQPRTTPK